jgi:hypothetical protein
VPVIALSVTYTEKSRLLRQQAGWYRGKPLVPGKIFTGNGRFFVFHLQIVLDGSVPRVPSPKECFFS